jgi:hypothetical protein
MAITQTGATQQFSISSSAQTGTVSTAITVPADAELVHVAVTHYNGAAGGLASLTFTKGGVDTIMVKATGGDASTSFMQVAVFTLVSPDTGTNKTLKWSWSGASSSSSQKWAVSFWKGIDTASPVRDSDGAQAGGVPFTTPMITAQTDDLALGWAGADASAGEGSVDTWLNLTLVTQCTRDAGGADGALASGSPTGNSTFAASTATNFADGGIVVVILKPAPAPPSGEITFHTQTTSVKAINVMVGY